MSLFTKLGNDIASPVDASGNLRSVDNADMQRWMTEAERLLAAQSMGAVTFGTLAQANASLAYDPWTTAWVLNDPVVGNNGWYTKTGASGAGGWVRLGDLPYCYIRSTNVGAGSENAIVATTTMPIPVADGGALISLNITSTNTATPVTVSFNGAAPLTIKTNAGNNPAIGGLVAGAVLAGYKTGTEFRLLSDQASASIVAAAEAAQLAAEAARDEALAAVPNVFPATIAALKAVDTNTHVVAQVMEDGRAGIFEYKASDLSAEMVARTIMPFEVASDEIRTRYVTSTSVDDSTEIINAPGHGFIADQEVTPASSVNGLVAGAKYFVYFDGGTAGAPGGNADNFKLRVSLTAGVSNLTGTTTVTLRVPHRIRTGMALRMTAATDDLNDDRLYYAIVTNTGAFKVADTPDDAYAGTAITLADSSTGFAVQVIADPLQGKYVVPSASKLDGSEGAWVRQFYDIYIENMGAVGDGVTESGYALQSALWLAQHQRRPVRMRAGTYITSIPLRYDTTDWLYQYAPLYAPDNGLYLYGEGADLSIIMPSAAFPNNQFLLTLDGNADGVAKLVASRPFAQGSTVIRGVGFVGRGKAFGANIGCIKERGLFSAELHDVNIRELSGNAWELATAGTVAPDDEVDNTSFLRLRNVRVHQMGKSAFVMVAARPTLVDMADCEIRRCAEWGIHAALVNSRISQTVIHDCGNTGDTTTGGIRLRDSNTGSRCRNVLLEQVMFEQNRNHNIDVLSCRGLTLLEVAHNPYPETGAWRAIKLRETVETRNVNIINNRFSDFSAPPNSDPKTDVFMIDIASGVSDVNIIGMSYDYDSSHVIAANATRLNIIGCPENIDVVTTGATPADTFVNGVCRGTMSSRTTFTPALVGGTTPGTVTGGSQTASYRIEGDEMVFSVNYTQTGHNGTGAATIVLDGLPNNFIETVPVELYFEGITYTSPPQALAAGGGKTILLRQAASGGAYSTISVPSGAATIRLNGRVRRY